MNAAGGEIMSLEHSNDKSDASPSADCIGVRFVADFPVQLQIKQLHKPMKSTLIENKPGFDPSFQIAPDTEIVRHTPFEELARFPEKLEASLNAAKIENDIFAASRKTGKKRATRCAAPENKNCGFWDPARSLIELKQIEFTLEAPEAGSVKLAADFTDWEKYPLDMIQGENGVWFTVVPLAPGHYSYRFIVDGQWCDDPRSNLRVENPFGTSNAVRQVA
jgi:Glycogen recognition site of AMP-activated protein kinase